MNGYCNAMTIRKVNVQWVLRDKKEWLGLEVVFKKLRFIFQRNGLTRNMKLMRKRKEKMQFRWLRIPDSWCPVREKSPCPFSLLCPFSLICPTIPFALGRSLCWKRWWWAWVPCCWSSCWAWVWPRQPWLRVTSGTNTSWTSTMTPLRVAGMAGTVIPRCGDEASLHPAKMSTPLFMRAVTTSGPSVKMKMEHLTKEISESANLISRSLLASS